MAIKWIALALVTVFSVVHASHYKLSALFGNEKVGEAFNTGGSDAFVKIRIWNGEDGYVTALQQLRRFGEGKEEGPIYGSTNKATVKEFTFGPGESVVVVGCTDKIGVRKLEFLIFNGKAPVTSSLCNRDETPFTSDSNTVGLRGTYATYVDPHTKATISMLTSVGFVYTDGVVSAESNNALLSYTVHGEYEGRKFIQGASDGIESISLFHDSKTKMINGMKVVRVFSTKKDVGIVGTTSGVEEKIEVGEKVITQMAGCITKKQPGIVGQPLGVTKLTFGFNNDHPPFPECVDGEESFWSYRVGKITGFRGYTRSSDNMPEHLGAVGFFYEKDLLKKN